MAAVPVLATGTTLTFNSTAVLGIISIEGIGSGSVDKHNVTTMASTAKESKPGLRDFGSITVNLIRDNDEPGQVALAAGLAAQTVASTVITLPTSTLNVATFSGYVESLTTDIPADGGVVTGKCTICITGAITWS